MQHEALVAAATAARENAIATFSHYRVGAALLAGDGTVHHGCNIENCTYGLTMCAERVALLSALAGGTRRFSAVAVVTDGDTPGTPCGPCRQLMWEFCGDIDVIVANLTGKARTFKLSELLPYPFDFKPEA